MLTEYAALKPWLTALLLPPGSPLLLMFLGYMLAVRSERIVWMALGKMLFVVSFASLWLFCSHGTAMFLERVGIRPPPPLDPQLVLPTFQSEQIQAIVVLGGGMQSASKEYGRAALSEASAQRLHYGATLARQTGVPIVFSAGRSWGAPAVSDNPPIPPINPVPSIAAPASSGKSVAKVTGSTLSPRSSSALSTAISLTSGANASTGTEAAAAQRWLSQLGLAPARWVEDQSRDTTGSAEAVASLMKKEGIERIALVTHASHMPRALIAFQATSLKVIPTPTHFLEAEQTMGLDWFPSGQGLRNSRRVLHEILGLAAQRR